MWEHVKARASHIQRCGTYFIHWQCIFYGVCWTFQHVKWHVTYTGVALHFMGNAFLWDVLYVGAPCESNDKSHTEMLHYISQAMHISWGVLYVAACERTSYILIALCFTGKAYFMECMLEHENARTGHIQRCCTLFHGQCILHGCIVCWSMWKHT